MLDRGDVAEEVSFPDCGHDGGGDHRLPGGVAFLDATEDVAGEYVQGARVETHDAFDIVGFEKMGVKVAQVVHDVDVFRVDQDG